MMLWLTCWGLGRRQSSSDDFFVVSLSYAAVVRERYRRCAKNGALCEQAEESARERRVLPAFQELRF